MSQFSNISDVWSFLDAIPMFAKQGASAANFGLESIRQFCEKLGNPHQKIKTIHIAGTNGKGTTARLLEWVYEGAGYSTGCYTSPHLLRYNERVRINGREISDDLILDFFREAEPFINECPLTYFEWSTALAFWAFEKTGVDFAIIECGLGGRLDSTNIINPELSIITSIGIDHQGILGDTEVEIAREKGGIIKPEVPVILGNIGQDALLELEQIAQRNRSEISRVSALNPQWEKGTVFLNALPHPILTQLKEPVNKWNIAAVKLAVDVQHHQWPVAEHQFKKAIETFSGVEGRFELLLKNKSWFFSGAHNQQALDATLQAIELLDKPVTTVILSMMKDKVKADALAPFKKFKKVYFYEQENERAAKIGDITPFLEVQPLENESVEKLFKELKTEVVIFVGSFYFYPTVKRWLKQSD